MCIEFEGKKEEEKGLHIIGIDRCLNEKAKVKLNWTEKKRRKKVKGSIQIIN